MNFADILSFSAVNLQLVVNMLSFVDSKSSSAKLAEWSPSDWPESLPEMRVILTLLTAGIITDFFL